MFTGEIAISRVRTGKYQMRLGMQLNYIKADMKKLPMSKDGQNE